MSRSIKIVALFSILFSIQFFSVSSVFACSGRPLTLDELIEQDASLVYGRIVESDNAGQNHIMQVEEYLIGNGAEYILLSQNSVELTFGLHVGRYGGGDCNSLRTVPMDMPVYTFVKQTDDGYYHQLGSIFSNGFYYFPDSESTNQLLLSGEEGSGVEVIDVEVTEAEFHALLIERIENSSPTPDENLAYPAYAPLLVTTENGTQYILPLDGGDAFQITDVELAIRLTGNPYYAGLLTNNTLEISENYDVRIIFESGFSTYINGYNIRLESDFETIDDVLISDNVNATFWSGNQFQIWTGNPEMFGARPARTLDGDEAVYGADFSAWSIDGSLFAYSDVSGLWLYDTINEEVELILEASEDGTIPYAREFSPSGRYLLSNFGGINIMIDLISGLHYPGDAISPDEQNSLYIQDDNLYFLPLQLLQTQRFDEFTVTDADWIDESQFVALICEPEEDCTVLHFDFQSSHYGRYEEPGQSFLVSHSGDVAVLVDGDTISINRIVHDLSLDSPIAELYWLPSLFYPQTITTR